MKKTYKNSDGTEVTVEGSPEEICEFERRQRQDGEVRETPKRGKKNLLLEEQLAEMTKKLDEIQKNRPYPYYDFHHFCVGCSWCQPLKFAPQLPWAQPWWDGRGTWVGQTTVTSDKTELQPSVFGEGRGFFETSFSDALMGMPVQVATNFTDSKAWDLD